jgi:hypothetical protein
MMMRPAVRCSPLTTTTLSGLSDASPMITSTSRSMASMPPRS